jgi:hypothetical protein
LTRKGGILIIPNNFDAFDEISYVARDAAFEKSKSNMWYAGGRFCYTPDRFAWCFLIRCAEKKRVKSRTNPAELEISALTKLFLAQKTRK